MPGLTLLTIAAGAAGAQTVSTFASGLRPLEDHPGAKWKPAGDGGSSCAQLRQDLHVGCEWCAAKSAGGIAIRTGPAPEGGGDGPGGLALDGRTLYIATAEGDTHVVGPRPGSILPNPAGPSSPMFGCILQVTFSSDLDKLPSGLTLGVPDQFTLMDGNTVTLTSSGETASLKLLTAFRPNAPDRNTIYRNTHLFGLTLLPSRPGVLFVADAGNDLRDLDGRCEQRARVLTRIAPTPNPIAPIGPPFSAAVPTSVRPYGEQLLVSLLSGVPFVPGAARVLEINPGSGNTSPLITDLSSAIDVLWRQRGRRTRRMVRTGA